MNPQLTDAGRNLLLRALAGETIKFTRIQLGDGAAQQPAEADALLSPKLTALISDFSIGDNYVTLTALFNNSGVDTGFRITEAGFFAEDPDDATNEILYALGNTEADNADYVPDRADRVLEMQYDAAIYIGDAENVTAAISGSLVYATKEALDEHIDDAENPHRVTKAQVGLDKVPNVTTNDQTPTYDVHANMDDLVSGEKMSTAFGKIKSAVSALIRHLASKSNPHSVTASQVGAAPAAHRHGAADITTGVLSVSRGGTGQSSHVDGGLLRGNGADALSAVRGIGALYSPTTGAPRFGVLPATHGGTGCTSTEQLAATLINSGLGKIVFGQYTGTGTSGVNGKNKLDFPMQPLLLVVMRTGFCGVEERFFVTPGVELLSDDLTGLITGNEIYFTWGEQTVQWYSSTPVRQLNGDRLKYNYIAILSNVGTREE